MTKQQAFDKVVLHLAKQKKRSVKGEGTSCAYRGSGKLACAIGCLLDDETAKACDISQSPKGTGIKDIWPSVSDKLVVDDLEESQALEFYVSLQLAHDASPLINSLEVLKTSLKSIAEEYDLDDSKISKITEWSLNMPYS